MSQDLPITGNRLIDTMTKVFAWLGKHTDQLIPRPPAPPPQAPAEMTDQRLHHAIHDIGAGLLNGLGPILQESFVRYGSSTSMSDPRFPHAMPVTVRGHVLTMVTEASDAFGLSPLGLREHASAAALGAIRIIAETLTMRPGKHAPTGSP